MSCAVILPNCGTPIDRVGCRHRAGAGNQSGGGKKGGKKKISPQLHSEHVLVSNCHTLQHNRFTVLFVLFTRNFHMCRMFNAVSTASTFYCVSMHFPLLPDFAVAGFNAIHTISCWVRCLKLC